MSMSDNIRQNISKAKDEVDPKAEVQELLNTSVSKSLKQFIQRLDAGEIPIDNMSDFVRVLGAYKEINDLSDGLDNSGGSGALPEINMKEEKAINDVIEDENITEEEEVNVENMSQEELDDLMRRVDVGQNKDNEESF